MKKMTKKTYVALVALVMAVCVTCLSIPSSAMIINTVNSKTYEDYGTVYYYSVGRSATLGSESICDYSIYFNVDTVMPQLSYKLKMVPPASSITAAITFQLWEISSYEDSQLLTGSNEKDKVYRAVESTMLLIKPKPKLDETEELSGATRLIRGNILDIEDDYIYYFKVTCQAERFGYGEGEYVLRGALVITPNYEEVSYHLYYGTMTWET